jgi:AcrR family transcriptional regulator
MAGPATARIRTVGRRRGGLASSASAERRQLIERSAERLFAERGYEATSLDDVAARAEVTKAIIYRHFESKAGLHAALLERQTEELLAFIGRRVADSGRPRPWRWPVGWTRSSSSSRPIPMPGG